MPVLWFPWLYLPGGQVNLAKEAQAGQCFSPHQPTAESANSIKEIPQKEHIFELDKKIILLH